jgi:hypothetical protein
MITNYIKNPLPFPINQYNNRVLHPINVMHNIGVDLVLEPLKTSDSDILSDIGLIFSPISDIQYLNFCMFMSMSMSVSMCSCPFPSHFPYLGPWPFSCDGNINMITDAGTDTDTDTDMDMEIVSLENKKNLAYVSSPVTK